MNAGLRQAARRRSPGKALRIGEMQERLKLGRGHQLLGPRKAPPASPARPSHGGGEMRKGTLDPFGERGSGQGWFDPGRMPVEQQHAQLPLQLGQSLRQRGLRQPRGLGRTVEAAQRNDADERAQMAQVEVERHGHRCKT